MANGVPWVWDYDIDEAQFLGLLHGELTVGSLDQKWAAVRLLECAPYGEIVRLLGFRRIVQGWPQWRDAIRSSSRRRGFDFLCEWLPVNHPELLENDFATQAHVADGDVMEKPMAGAPEADRLG